MQRVIGEGSEVRALGREGETFILEKNRSATVSKSINIWAQLGMILGFES